MTHTYRQLGAPELLTWFAKITGGYIIKGRDTRALAYYMDNHNLRPTQVLLAMYDFAEMPTTKDIPSFLRSVAIGEMELHDVMECEIWLAEKIARQPIPACAATYLDLLEPDFPDTVQEQAWQEAKIETENWLHDVLDAPASIGSRSRAAQRGEFTRPSSPHPGGGAGSR